MTCPRCDSPNAYPTHCTECDWKKGQTDPIFTDHELADMQHRLLRSIEQDGFFNSPNTGDRMAGLAIKQLRTALAPSPVAAPTQGTTGRDWTQHGIKREGECVWVQDSDGTWNTSCDKTWEYNDGGPHQNDAHFCYHCGGALLPEYFSDDEPAALAPDTPLQSATQTEPTAAPRARDMSGHRCHWPGCEQHVPPAMWGCKAHWFSLPKRLRDRIWAAYRRGQEVTKTPSAEYVDAAHEVQHWISEYRQSTRHESGT